MLNHTFKIISILIVGLALSTCSDKAEVATYQGNGLTIQSWQSRQGAKVMYVQAPQLPMLDIRLVFNAGSARDGEQYGVASMTSVMLRQGAGDWNTDQVAERLDEVGAQFSANAARDMATLSLRSLTDAKLLKQAIDTFKAVVTRPAFNVDDFKREKARRQIAIKSQQQSPAAIVSKAFYKEVFANHPYAHSSLGEAETIAALKIEDVILFYKKYYVASNATIAIVGAIKREQAEQLVDEILAGLDKGEPAAKLPNVKMRDKPDTVHIEYPSTQTHIMVGQPGMQRGDPDYFALYVGNHILGGSGFSSLIMGEIREKRGLAYSSYSYFSPMAALGPFIMGLQTKNNQVDEALKVLDKILRGFIDKGPTAKQLEHAIKNITGGFPLRIDSNKDITEYLAMIGFYDLPLDYLSTFNDKVSAITAKDIQDAFKRRINPDTMVTVTVGKTSK